MFLHWQTDLNRLVPNQSVHGKYNLISGWFNKNSKIFLCVWLRFLFSECTYYIFLKHVVTGWLLRKFIYLFNILIFFNVFYLNVYKKQIGPKVSSVLSCQSPVSFAKTFLKTSLAGTFWATLKGWFCNERRDRYTEIYGMLYRIWLLLWIEMFLLKPWKCCE